MNPPRRNIITKIVAASAAALLASGCGDLVERATEEAVEEVIERAAESEGAGNVEVDLNGDGISIESDEGDVTLQVDEDGVQIDGQDAEGNDFSLEGDETGINAESEDGSFEIDEDGSFTATDADGEVTTGELSVDGEELVVEGEDGDTTFATGEGIPDNWPDDVPEPDGLDDAFYTATSSSDSSSFVLAGTTSTDVQEAYDDYVDELEDAGFTNDSDFNQPGGFYSGTFVRDDFTVTITTQAAGDVTNLTVTID